MPLPSPPSDSATDHPPRCRPTAAAWLCRPRFRPGLRTRTPPTTSSSSISPPGPGASPHGRRRAAPETVRQGSRPFPTTDRSSPSPAKPTTWRAPTTSGAPTSTSATCPSTGPSGWIESANVHAGDRPADHRGPPVSARPLIGRARHGPTAERSQPDEATEVVDEIADGAGLVEDPVGGRAAAGGDRGRVEGGEEEDGGGRRGSAQRRQGVDAGRARHGDVEEDQVGLVLRGELDRRGGAGGHAHHGEAILDLEGRPED